MSEINRRDINRCTCHCGSDLFYRHLHAASCPVSVAGEKAPITENAALRAEVERLTQELAASQARVQELEEESRQWETESLVALLKQRDRLRTALTAIAEQTTEAVIRSQAQQLLGESVKTDRPEL